MPFACWPGRLTGWQSDCARTSGAHTPWSVAANLGASRAVFLGMRILDTGRLIEPEQMSGSIWRLVLVMRSAVSINKYALPHRVITVLAHRRCQHRGVSRCQCGEEIT